MSLQQRKQAWSQDAELCGLLSLLTNFFYLFGDQALFVQSKFISMSGVMSCAEIILSLDWQRWRKHEKVLRGEVSDIHTLYTLFFLARPLTDHTSVPFDTEISSKRQGEHNTPSTPAPLIRVQINTHSTPVPLIRVQINTPSTPVPLFSDQGFRLIPPPPQSRSSVIKGSD